MSTEPKAINEPLTPIDAPLSMRDLTAVLVKHYGLTQGSYDLMVEYQIGTGAVGPDKDNLLPGAMIGVSRIGLMPTTKPGATTVDAARANPGKKPAKKRTT